MTCVRSPSPLSDTVCTRVSSLPVNVTRTAITENGVVIVGPVALTTRPGFDPRLWLIRGCSRGTGTGGAVAAACGVRSCGRGLTAAGTTRTSMAPAPPRKPAPDDHDRPARHAGTRTRDPTTTAATTP